MHARSLLVWISIAALCLAVTSAEAQTTPPPAGDELKPAPAASETSGEPEATGAAEDGEQTETGEEKPPGGLLGGPKFILIMLGGIVLLYLWMGRSRRKQEAKRKEMLAGLSKGDKITSIGGVVGTVIEVRQDEVVVKVDETNNIRMRFARWAIRGVGEQAKVQRPEDNK